MSVKMLRDNLEILHEALQVPEILLKLNHAGDTVIRKNKQNREFVDGVVLKMAKAVYYQSAQVLVAILNKGENDEAAT